MKMSDTSDLDRQIEQLKRCEIIQEGEVKALCAKAREILVEESNVQRVDSPVTVITVFLGAVSSAPAVCKVFLCILFCTLANAIGTYFKCLSKLHC